MEKSACLFSAGTFLYLRRAILIMKLSTFFLFIALQVSAANHAQEVINLKADNISIQQIFAQIEKQTRYRFYYSSDDLPVGQKFTINIVNAGINQTLSKLLNGTSIKWEVIPKNRIVLTSSEEPVFVSAQYRQLTGVVRNEAGEAIPMASVNVKGTNRGVVTDKDGNFRIEAAEGDVLEISAIGYATIEISIGSSGNIAVTLKTQAKQIEEVVVVGYGTQKRVNLSGAVNTVNTAQITSRPVTSLTNSLQGIVPGMVILARPGDVGSDIGSINVRGRGNLGTSSPLFVVDGVPVSAGDFARINPADVESISVLKDASASSIYGSRAAYGVILVKTKSGKKGGKAVVNYNGYYGSQKPTVLPHWLGSYDYAILSNEAAQNAGGAAPFSDAQLQKIKDGSALDSFPNNDWYKLALRSSAPITEHQVNVSGGGTTRYYFSGAFFKQGSLIPNKDLKRYSFRSNVESQVSEKLKIGTNISYVRDDIDSKSGPLSFVSLNRVIPLLVNKQSNGEWGSMNGGKIDATLAADNPVRKLQEGGRNSSAGNRFIGNLTGTFTPVEGLDLNGLFSYNNFNSIADAYLNRMNPIPNFITGAPLNSTAVTVNQLTEDWVNNTSLLSQFTANYEKRIARHFLKLLVGTSYENNKSRALRVIRKNFVNDELNSIDAGSTDPLNTTVTGTIPGVSTSGIQQNAMFSAFGRLNYSYNETYFLEANFRGDESSRFAPGHRWGYYPSFSGAWRISKEAFMQNIAWLSELKLRGSWGKLGNINNVGNYDFFDGLSSGTVAILDEKQQDGVSPGKLANPNLSWEKVTMTDLGLDVSLFKNKVSLQADWFNKITNDILLTDQSVPAEAGLSSSLYPSRNMGKVQNRGVEVSLNYANHIGGFSYSIGGNFSKIKNKILSLGNADNTDMISGYYINRVGAAVGSFYMYKADGLFVSDDEVAGHAKQFSNTKAGDIKYVDQDGNKQIDANDRVITGNDVPYLTYGANATLGYKNFDFSIIGQGVSGVQVYLENEASQAFFNGAGVKAYVLGRWTSDNPNPNAVYPRVLRSSANAQNLQLSSFWLFNADYFRIKSLSFGYSLPAAVLERAKIKGLRVYYSSNNPFTFRGDKRMKDFDVEAPSARAAYPQLKSYSIGVNLTF
ncbi:TonB-dependent receptor [Niabella sp.]|uniref:SusC/RagA family TonB-linked outer membrane protein n=1 Tax=Niabella sp. TaxID=1962976 RepID=UPI00261B8EC9|nr:TonB-dependent receptor [Niabella sp.]